MGVKGDVFRGQIVKFIRQHHKGELSKAEVVKYMDDLKEGCSRMTTLKHLKHLEKDEIIEVRRINNQLCSLVFNTKSEFNKIVEEIDRLERFVGSLHDRLNSPNNPDASTFRNEIIFRDIMLTFYLRMSIIARKITGTIKSLQDRDALNLRLAQILFDSYTLGSALSSEYIHHLQTLKPESKQDKFVNDVVGWALRDLR